MDTEIISKDRLNYTIDTLITMVVDELAETSEKSKGDILTDFLLSNTGKSLYDASTKLWCCGPSYLADLYREEVAYRQKNGNQ